MSPLFERSTQCLLLMTLVGTASPQTLHTPGGTVGNIGGSNVGVGTSSPQYRLEVSGDGAFSKDATTQVTVHNSSGSSNRTAGVNFRIDATNLWQLLTDNADGNKFFLQYANSTADRFLTVTPSGNVGIGNTNPAQKLSVSGDIMASTGRLFSSYASNEGGNLVLVNPSKSGATASNWVLWNMTGAYGNGLSFWRYYADGTNPGPSVWFGDNGNVGIGTTSPSEKLSVFGTSNAAPGILSLESSREDAQNVEVGRISAKNSAVETSRISLLRADGSYSGYITFSTRAGNGTPLVEAMRLDKNGNVGFGTTSPSQKLSVGVADSDPAVSTANSIAAIGSSGKITAIGANSTYGWLQSYNAPLYINSAGNNTIVNGSGSGNVGIGTTNPSHKLAVNGTIRAKEVIVDTSWADHVFAEGYRLAPLDEVEQHIREKRHLPGIPSAAEVEAGGVSLGDMQVRLLAKIEELTLHLIELKRENEAMKSRLAHMESNLTP